MTDIELELYHHGVKGMKWGVRKKYQAWKEKNANKKIRRIETTREENKLERKLADDNLRDKYDTPKKAEKLAFGLATNKATYEHTEVTNKYLTAVQKARKDKTYKQSNEYQRAKMDYAKQCKQDYIWGPQGTIRVNALKATGKSDRQAKSQVVAETALAGIGILAISGFVGYMNNR